MTNILVKYECLPNWCAVCGMIDHMYTEHGDGVRPPSTLVFKDLCATWSMWSCGRGLGGRRHGSRRDQGHAPQGNWYYDDYTDADGGEYEENAEGGDIDAHAQEDELDEEELLRRLN